MSTAVAAPHRPSQAVARNALPAIWLGGCIVVGGTAALTAYLGFPKAFPELCAGIALIAVTIVRPEIGIAAWFLLVPLGLQGIKIGPQWLLSSVWALFLFALALSQRPRAASWADQHPTALRSWRSRLPPLTLALLVLVALTLLETMLDVHPRAALAPIRTIVTGSLAFFAIATLIRTRTQVMWVLGGAVAAGALIGAVAVEQYRLGNTAVGFITQSGDLVPRATAGFGGPNSLGGFLAILVPLAITGALLAHRGRLLYLAAGVLCLAGVYVSFSRGALLAVATIPLVFVGLRRAMLLGPVAAILVLAAVPGVLKERFATVTSGGADVATRSDFWRTAEHIWSAHPILGVGPGGFPQAYADINLPGKAFLPSSPYLPASLFEPPPHAHNLVLNLLAEQGILGAVAFLVLLGLSLVGLMRVRRSRDRWLRLVATGLLATLVVLMVHNQFDVTLGEGTGQFVWALLGLCSALISIEAARGSRAGASRPMARAPT